MENNYSGVTDEKLDEIIDMFMNIKNCWKETEKLFASIPFLITEIQYLRKEISRLHLKP